MPIVAALLFIMLAACGRSAPPPAAEAPPRPSVLRVCSDPNNLPFSSEREEGFENRIAELLARELDAELQYEWRPQRRGFIRNGLNAGACDVVIGMATDVDMALTSRPYYRSGYAFVGASPHPLPRTLDDPALAALRIGVQIVGDDYANTPPVHALARRGLARNLVGFTLYGDYREEAPPADPVRAVARGDVDIAIAWGPIAGYFARRAAPPLQVALVEATTTPDPPMHFDISLAVARRNRGLLVHLEAILDARRDEIDAILDQYGVPRA